MSSSKKDRTTAPRLGTRASRARHVDDRNVKPPAGVRRAAKPKPGARAMNAQLGERPPGPLCHCGCSYEAHEDDACTKCGCQAWSPASEPSPPAEAEAVAIVTVDPDAPPPADPWWTVERERAFALALQGIPQHQIAAELGRDRHTIARWEEDERFSGRLYDENTARFKASRQRRGMQTLQLTDKANRLANKFMDKAIDLAEKGKDDLGIRLASRDWLQEFRENSRREDEIFGLDKQRVDVNVHGSVQHQHKGKVDVTFKTFLTTSLQGLGVDPSAEEIDAGRADEALVAVTERALTEGTFLDDLVKRERELLANAAGRGSP